MKFKTDSKRLI